MYFNKTIVFSSIIALTFFMVGGVLIFISLNNENDDKLITLESIELVTDSLVKIQLRNEAGLQLKNLNFVFVDSSGQGFFYNLNPSPESTAEYFIDASTISGLTNFLDIKKIYIEYTTGVEKIVTK